MEVQIYNSILGSSYYRTDILEVVQQSYCMTSASLKGPVLFPVQRKIDCVFPKDLSLGHTARRLALHYIFYRRTIPPSRVPDFEIVLQQKLYIQSNC